MKISVGNENLRYKI